jgi:hypothetical protein
MAGHRVSGSATAAGIWCAGTARRATSARILVGEVGCIGRAQRPTRLGPVALSLAMNAIGKLSSQIR